MERVRNINPQRIVWNCKEFGITPEILSEQLRISWDNLEKTMQGDEGITVNQLRKIADYFERGILFFLDDKPVNEDIIYTLQFRTLTGQKPYLSPELRVLIERVEKQREIYISLLDELGENVETDWTNYKLPSNTLKDIKQSAARVRKWLELENQESFDTYRFKVENKGIFVFVTNGYIGQWRIAKDDPIRGFSLYYPTYPIIAIKKQSSARPQAFTLMHELGHILLHRDGFIDEEKDFYSTVGKEKVANEFAGNVLVPDEFLFQINTNEFPFNEVNRYNGYLTEFRQKWGVSVEVILRRLLNEGILEDKYYNEYRDYVSSLPIKSQRGGNRINRYQEPVKMFGKPFVGAVLNAFHENRIPLTKASTYLDNIKINDVHKLEKMYGRV
ncbi:MAG: ImmA/IrrE family metallo-endopeptidase [Planctomycetia bacterium]|nr:ImmA/IrrE family metallo-endopeptidase [Planctomycetia bacterium]